MNKITNQSNQKVAVINVKQESLVLTRYFWAYKYDGDINWYFSIIYNSKEEALKINLGNMRREVKLMSFEL